MTKPLYWDEATRALAEQRRVLARLIAHYPGVHLTRRGDPFTTLARAIVGQQISVKAAQTIWERVAESLRRAATARPLDPARVRRRAHRDAARTAACRERKAEYIRDLARPFRVRRVSIRAHGRRSTTRR